MLKLINGEAEVFVSGSGKHLTKNVMEYLSVGSSKIMPSEQIESLGCTIDSRLTMENHVKQLCRRACIHLYIQHIAKFGSILLATQLKTWYMPLLVLGSTMAVSSRLDYGS